MHMEYPKWVFHGTLPARLVQDPGQHEALGDGWAETPAAFDAPAEELQFGVPHIEVVPDDSAPVKKMRKGR